MTSQSTVPPKPSAQNPVATNTGQEHSPTRADYEQKKRHEKITQGAEAVEDRQSRDYWREQQKSKEQSKEKASAVSREKAAVKSKGTRPVGRPPGSGKKKKVRGVEMPKAGFSRLGNASRGLGSVGSGGGMGGYGDGGAGYSDPFSMGNEFSNFRMAGQDSGMRFEIGSFSGLLENGGGGGRDRGYVDPFASMTPGKRGRKPRDTYTSPFDGMFTGISRGRGRPPKSLFGGLRSGLF